MTADEIRALRARLGLTPAEFGGRLGVKMRAVYAWESGERVPGGATMILLEQMAKKAERAGKKGGNS